MRFVDVGMIFILTLYTKNLKNCFNFKKCRDDACLKSLSLKVFEVIWCPLFEMVLPSSSNE